MTTKNKKTNQTPKKKYLYLKTTKFVDIFKNYVQMLFFMGKLGALESFFTQNSFTFLVNFFILFILNFLARISIWPLFIQYFLKRPFLYFEDTMITSIIMTYIALVLHKQKHIAVLVIQRHLKWLKKVRIYGVSVYRDSKCKYLFISIMCNVGSHSKCTLFNHFVLEKLLIQKNYYSHSFSTIHFLILTSMSKYKSCFGNVTTAIRF
ncbi:hypothetical protein RFI_29006 [Reticulomyxa filosa]|uniref:Transmembrane protein n=1 Tax=Reticulomyxa filosa TaxID=46433 RepID=X6M4K9_RETFI|nr:hypothetical protein RFI_29006 [Reticulomyxa filosa]|eukprot:ETO08382.1 hypothetical protein RFI_29006 [Reticulomyxa filosa]